MKIADRLIERAKRTPYFHLYHGDGSLYMERYWLVPFTTGKEGCYVATWRQSWVWVLQKLGIAVRVHHILTPDLDRDLHDHPWTFVSIVLKWWYREARPRTANNAIFEKVLVPLNLPIYAELTPEAISRIINPPVMEVEQEPVDEVLRGPGSIALRRFFHRHRITAVAPDGVWTLFITFPKRQSWGFFTPFGKVWWWKYESVHNTAPVQ